MTDWEPVPETRDDVVTAGAAKALHDLLDRDGAAPAVGDGLPILWHWLAFLPQARQSEIGVDGHPRTGGFLPPTHGRRRMYAGGKVDMTGSIAVGAPLRRHSIVKKMAHKSGRTGDLFFVTVGSRIAADQGVIQERTDLVYKEPAPTIAPAASQIVDTDGIDPDVDKHVLWGRDVPIDPVLLFRFSALTYNAHRIHYDRAYATATEGYPGLVVHGPLQAILLADAAGRAFPDRSLTSFAFRSSAPAFDSHPLQLRVRAGAEPRTAHLTAYSAGVATMTATAEFVEAPRAPASSEEATT